MATTTMQLIHHHLTNHPTIKKKPITIKQDYGETIYITLTKGYIKIRNPDQTTLRLTYTYNRHRRNTTLIDLSHPESIEQLTKYIKTITKTLTKQ